MISAYPAIIRPVSSATVNNTRNRYARNSYYYKKVGARLVLPGTIITYYWYGVSDIIWEYTITASKDFSILSSLRTTEYCAAISWVNNTGETHRYKLWEDVGEIFYYDLYNGQLIGKDFKVEIWNTKLLNIGDSTTITIADIILYTSLLINIEGHCYCTCEAANDLLSFPITDGPDINYDNIMPVIDSCCGYDLTQLTTDNVKTVVVRFPIITGVPTKIIADAKVSAVDFSSIGFFKETKGFIRISGTTSEYTVIESSRAAGPDGSTLFLETDGNNIIVSVQGVVATSITWLINIKIDPPYSNVPVPLPPPSPSPILNNIVAYYKCDELMGSLVDASGNTNTLIIQDVSNSGSGVGVINTGRTFNGVTPDYFGVVDAAHTNLRFGPKNRTVGIHIKVTALGATQTIFYKNHEVLCVINATGHIVLTYLKADNTTAAAVTSTAVLVAGVYAYVVLKYNVGAGTVSIQIDTNAIDSAVQTAIPGDGTTANAFNLGAQAGVNPFTGIMDEIIICDADLTLSDLTVLRIPTAYPFQ